MTRLSDRIYRAPIAILSFDRPDYLNTVLTSLAAQQDCQIETREVILFQDGAKNPYSGEVYLTDDIININKSLFKRFFPNSPVHISPVNLGIGLHFDLIEHMMFDEKDSLAVIFLEDDFVLSPSYISVLDALTSQALDDSRIGYVSAVGDHTLPLEEQHRRRRQPIIMRRNWAFSVTHKQWEANRLYVDQYMALIRKVDYRKRPHLEIFDLYSSWGVARIESSQDRAKSIASTLNGSLRLSTTPCYGKYIGVRGEHSNEKMYELSGFGNTPIYNEKIDSFGFISSSKYIELLAEQQRDIQGVIPTLRASGEIRFASGHEGALALGRGFQPPEDWGVWSSSTESSVCFTPDFHGAVGPFEVEVTCRYHLPDSIPSAIVRVIVDDIPAGELSVGQSIGSYVIRLPTLARQSSGTMKLTFITHILGSPLEYRGYSDERKLGLGLVKINLNNCAKT